MNTTVVCKVFEGFVRDSLYNHFIENNLLSDNQFGFCKGRSCVTQLLVTIDEWMKHLDDNIPVDAIYLDFHKAFYSVPHKRLINKVKGYGVKGKVLNWVEDFLSDRKQYCSVNGKKSDTVPVTSGVPQGSVLGPTLFIYFINDLPDVVDEQIKIFADDTKAYTPIRNVNDNLNLQKCLDSLVSWCEKWLLPFNSKKCKVLHLGHNNNNFQYKIREGGVTRELDKTVVEKDLGVQVDDNLKFNQHMLDTTKKSRNIAAMIMRTISFKTPEIMVPLFKALVRPILEYANPVWCPHTKKDIEALERVQRHYTKRLVGMKDLSYSQRLAILNLPSLEFRRMRGDLIETYKILTNIYDPLTTHSLLTMSTTNHLTGSNSFKLFKGRTNTKHYHIFFTNIIINLWNSLPEKVVSADSLNSFKNQIDKHFNKYRFLTDIEFLYKFL